MKHKEWLPRYEEWKKTANEMGFNETGYGMIIGKYRNHNVDIDQIGLGDSDSADLKTRYRVNFENPQMILLYIKKRFSGHGSSLSKEYIRDIHLDNPQLLQGLVIKGNNENAIKSILDSSICNRIMNIKDSLYEMEVGHGKPVHGKHKWLQIEIEPNVARFIDSRSLQETKGNALKFRLILDTIIDIVEKIETYASTIHLDALTATEYEKEKKLLQSATSVVVYCSKCGAANPADSKFCPHCGNVIEVVSMSEDMTQEEWELHVAEFFPRCPLCGSKSLEFGIKYGREHDYINCHSCYARWEIDWKGKEYEIDFIKLVEVKDIEKIRLKGEKHEPDFWLRMANNAKKK